MSYHRSLVCRIALLTIAAVASGIPGIVAPASAQTLTDIVLFRTNGGGNTISEGWNTRGSDGVSNLYLTTGGNDVNSGNGAATNVAINLSLPGTYTFSFAGDNVNGNTTPQLGLNFFFNNNATTPRISARGIGTGAFSALSGTTNTPGFGTVPGSGSLSFSDSGLSITLSAFTYQTTSGADLVTSFNNAPGGTADSVGSFTLTVAPVTVPEVSPLSLLALGGVIDVFVRRCKR